MRPIPLLQYDEIDVCGSAVWSPEIIPLVLLLSSSIFVFYGIHIHLQIVKIEEYSNKNTILQYKIFRIEHQNSDMFRPFIVGHPQEVYISIL
jgi:hypothetical protein